MDLLAGSQMWTPGTWILHIGSTDKDACTWIRQLLSCIYRGSGDVDLADDPEPRIL